MSLNIGDASRKRVEEIDKELPGLEKELESLTTKVKGLRQERRDTARVLRMLEGPKSNGSPAVTDEQILETVVSLGVATSKDVAEKLKVTPRNVARKLRKLVDDGALVGTPDEGYKPIAA